MNIQQIESKIKEFNKEEKKAFNQNCTSKIYNESDYSLTQQELDDVIEVAEMVDSLSLSDLETLQLSLSSNRQLSKRPC